MASSRKQAKSPAQTDLTRAVRDEPPKRGTRRRIVLEIDTGVSRERFNTRAVHMAQEFLEYGEEAVLLTTEDVE